MLSLWSKQFELMANNLGQNKDIDKKCYEIM